MRHINAPLVLFSIVIVILPQKDASVSSYSKKSDKYPFLRMRY